VDVEFLSLRPPLFSSSSVVQVVQLVVFVVLKSSVMAAGVSPSSDCKSVNGGIWKVVEIEERGMGGGRVSS